MTNLQKTGSHQTCQLEIGLRRSCLIALKALTLFAVDAVVFDTDIRASLFGRRVDYFGVLTQPFGSHRAQTGVDAAACASTPHFNHCHGSNVKHDLHNIVVVWA